MIARPKMSQIEWTTTEIRAWQSCKMSHPFPAQAHTKDLVSEVQAAADQETFVTGLTNSDADGALEDTAILHEIIDTVEEKREDARMKVKAVAAFGGLKKGVSSSSSRDRAAAGGAPPGGGPDARFKVKAAGFAANAFRNRASAYEAEAEDEAKARAAFQRATSRVKSANYESSKGLHRLTASKEKFKNAGQAIGAANILNAKRRAGASLRSAAGRVRDSLGPKVAPAARPPGDCSEP